MFEISEAQRAYGQIDMEDWRSVWGDVPLTFPENFPIRTVLPLRISLLEPKTIKPFYEAAWVVSKSKEKKKEVTHINSMEEILEM